MALWSFTKWNMGQRADTVHFYAVTVSCDAYNLGLIKIWCLSSTVAKWRLSWKTRALWFRHLKGPSKAWTSPYLFHVPSKFHLIYWRRATSYYICACKLSYVFVKHQRGKTRQSLNGAKIRRINIMFLKKKSQTSKSESFGVCSFSAFLVPITVLGVSLKEFFELYEAKRNVVLFFVPFLKLNLSADW